MAAVVSISDNRLIAGIHRHRGLMVPTGAILLIVVLLVPLSTSLLDLLLVASLTLSAVILVTTIYVTQPLEFSVFPSLLLGTTLLRLVLNTATTRLILTAGDRTSAGNATEAAGKVIETFGNFVAGGSLAVGVIIFVILVVIQFVVITKGSTRISEVAARFTLDAMPGKQMAIDADLNAGLINEVTARQRRQQITREADFYGAMDGASKFVRGDAIAGIIITIVNILGGLYVGMIEYNWTFHECLTSFTKLTIGDGLVSQIPAFIISISAGLIVTRSASESNLGEEMLGQLTAKPIALVIAAVFLGMLMITPLPKPPLLLLGGSCAAVAWILSRTRVKQAAADSAAAMKAAAPKKEPEKIESLLAVEPMELEVGYGLVRMVDAAAGGDLLDRISLIRRQIATELGILVPPIRIRDNMQLSPNEYAIKIRGTQVARGEAFPGQFLAMDSGVASERIPGRATTEPAFGLPALWIGAETKP
ncbi:MAG: FHIPEP family type III secretion protein, partial [Phycisphaerae bacterium]|nr:FHIPEP family type III secretion protein [Phycisphaerae bacterium]